MATKKRRRKKSVGAGPAALVGQEVVLTRTVQKVEKIKATCIDANDQTVTLEFVNRGRLIRRTYPVGSINDISVIEYIEE